jgi:hypothetical protein
MMSLKAFAIIYFKGEHKMGLYGHVASEIYMLVTELEKFFPDYEFSIAGSVGETYHMTRGRVRSDARRIVFRKKGEDFFDGYLPTQELKYSRLVFKRPQYYSFIFYIKNLASVELEKFADNRKVLGY